MSSGFKVTMQEDMLSTFGSSTQGLTCDETIEDSHQSMDEVESQDNDKSDISFFEETLI